MSINWLKSAELNGVSVEALKARFERFPRSNKKVIAVCDNPDCQKERKLFFSQYHDLCRSCVNKTPEVRKNKSDGLKRYFEDPGARKKNSEAKKKYFEDNPEAGKEHGKRVRKYFEDPEAHEKASKAANKRWEDPDERKKASDITKKHYEDHPEIREEHSEKMKKHYEDPEYFKKHCDVMKKVHNTPEAKKNQSKAQKKRFEDPEERKKTSDINKKRFEDPEARKKMSAIKQGILIEDWTGYTEKDRPHLTPKNNCIHLNSVFEGCNQHHIMSGVIINIPVDLHRSIQHSIPHDNYNGKNMLEINKLAFEYLMGY